MRSVFIAGALLAAATFATIALSAQELSADAFLGADPAADQAHPASMVEITVPSHGVQLLGVLYTPSGAGPHPTAIIFHGFPGYEQNLDLAQTLRRSGYNVLAVHYRGSWGVAGSFSHQHAIEDADAELDWITSPAVIAKYAVDPAHVVVIGHSMGGYMALSAAAHHPSVRAAIAVSGASLGHRFAGWSAADRDKAVALYTSRANPVDYLPLIGASPATLGGEVFDHREEWDFLKLAPQFGTRPVLLITANDGSGPNSEALLQALKAAGNTESKHIEMQTDHPFSDHRVSLEREILVWLGERAR